MPHSDGGASWPAAFSAVGVRESDTSHLEEAVAAFRAALEEWTRDRVPLRWLHCALAAS
jgi:hypothetical protein